jgi:replicative DNA helicase
MSVLRDHETERRLLATLLSMPSTLKRLLVDEGIRPEHFAVGTHGRTFTALVTLAERGDHIDRLTLTRELEHASIANHEQLVQSILGEPPEPAALVTDTRRILDLHRRRQLKLAAEILSDAADRGDAARLAEAEALLTTPDDTEPSSWSGKELAELYFDRLDAPAAETFNWPFRKLDAWTGGLRRKQIVLIGGWTANGKSVLYDQILEKLATQGLNVHSYINEMSVDERMDRTVARLSGVPFPAVYGRRTSGEQKAAILAALTQVRVGMTECAGWTAAEIARHIRWHRWDVAGVDIVHEIAHREERDLAEIAQILRVAAKQTGCALIACVHLNDNRVTAPQRPVPVLRDVRGSGMLVRGADIVLLIHRDDDDDGVPGLDGILLASKIRNGQPSAMKVSFRPREMRFTPLLDDHDPSDSAPF